MLSKRLKEILNEKKISLEYYSQLSGVPMETLRNIYYGRTSNPNIKTVMAMAEALDMTINSLLGVENTSTNEERKLINYYRSCGTHGKNVILNIAKYEANMMNESQVGLRQNKIICLKAEHDVFVGKLYDPENPYEIYTNKKEAYMAFETMVNDAAPTYCKGDIILIENRFPRSGEHGVFIKDEKIMLKEFVEKKEGYCLNPIHRIGSEILFKKLDSIECLGTCCGLIRV
ncbi:MAG: helix-turn-helix domain-containing protein [Lachnospiraceae bacterium]|nr:helix-turn-helix domain-containing protein [Lachnospiraceae bacterium]